MYMYRSLSRIVAVSSLKSKYSSRRPSLSSVSLSSSIDLRSPPLTPLSPPTPLSLSASSVSLPGAQAASAAAAARAAHVQAQNSSAKVLAQSDNLTQFEHELLPTILSKKAKVKCKVTYMTLYCVVVAFTRIDCLLIVQHRDSDHRPQRSTAQKSTAPGSQQAARGKQPQRTPATPGSAATSEGERSSPEENKRSRVARRRQRQKERQRENDSRLSA